MLTGRQRERLKSELRWVGDVWEASGVGVLCLGLLTFYVPAHGLGALIVSPLVLMAFLLAVVAVWMVTFLLGLLLLRGRKVWATATVIFALGTTMVVLAGLFEPVYVLLAPFAALLIGLIVFNLHPAFGASEPRRSDGAARR